MEDAPTASIVLTRVKSGWRDRLRSYRVVLDGAVVARVRNRGTVALHVSPGSHEVEVAIDWVRTAPVASTVAADQEIRLVCGPSTDMAPRDAVRSVENCLFLRRED